MSSFSFIHLMLYKKIKVPQMFAMQTFVALFIFHVISFLK
ncbi:hypothetical protein BCSJ1_09543 [Bacillus cereus SJ1]|nr:hypothetical protein BCSJ1_09543 [Bacillus cereus SJ1]